MKLINTIYRRIVIYVVTVGIFLIILFFFLFQFKRKSEIKVFDTARSQFVREVNYLFDLNSTALIQNTYDCSYWDDFILAIDKRDTNWVKENITLTESYKYEFVCIYDQNLDLVFDLSNIGQPNNKFINKGMLRSITKRKNNHFFIKTKQGLMEFAFSSIHPNNDPGHSKTLPSGYILVGRKYDIAYLNKMAQIFGSNVQLFSIVSSNSAFEKDVISSTINLRGWDGKVISSLVFTRQLSHNFAITQSLIYLILFTILLVLILFLLFARMFIDKPLKLTTNILESECEQSIAKLKMQPDEFGRIGELFERFTKQKVELKLAIEKSKESDMLKSAFLANMSHEIRTPMNGILGFADLLKQQKLSGTQQKKYLDVIESSGTRMLNIVNNIIDISKIESGTIEINNKVTNLNEQINFIVNFFTPEIEKKGLQLIFEEALPAQRANIITDEDKFYGVLMNLVSNAIKHTQKGFVEIGYKLDEQNNKLVFSVKDSGSGIPDGKLKIIFDRFMQADMSNKTAYQGAGLGLSISKAYVEMLGGTIWVQSTYNLGSTFSFTLPYTCSDINVVRAKETLVEDAYTRLEGVKLKILIVEDDPGMEFLLTETVQQYCSELLVARDGMEALEICKRHLDINLILMDIRIPKMDGYETTEEIRRFNKEVVIIAQTACAFSSDKEKALDAGFDDYMSKPINTERFEKLVEQYFAESSIVLS